MTRAVLGVQASCYACKDLKIMGMRRTAAVAGLTLGLMSGTAKASLIFDIQTTAITNDVFAIRVEGSGSLNVQNLFSYDQPADPNGFPTGIAGDPPYVGVGDENSSTKTRTYIALLTGPRSLGPATLADWILNPYTYSGNYFGFNFGGNNNPPDPNNVYSSNSFVFLPFSYVSGSELGVSTNTYIQYSTYSNAGLNPGLYVYNVFDPLNVATGDTITVNIDVSTVPLPASAPLFGAALLGLAGLGYAAKRKKAAAAA